MACSRSKSSAKLPQHRASLAVALMLLTAKLAGADLQADESNDGVLMTRRASPALLRQLAGLADDNKRLKSEVDALTAQVEQESAVAYAVRKATAEAHAAEAASRVRLAELEHNTTYLRAVAEQASLQRVDLQFRTAEANATAHKRASEAVRIALEEAKVRERVAAAEAERARADAAKEASTARLRAEEARIAELQVAQLHALKEAAALNASRALSEAEAAAADARAAEDRRRSAEAAAREAESRAMHALVSQKLAAAAAAGDGKCGGSGASDSSAASDRVLSQLESHAATASHAAAQLTAQLADVTAATQAAAGVRAQQAACVEQLTAALAQGQAALEAARGSASERDAAAVRKLELELTSLELQLRIAEEATTLAHSRQAIVQDQLRRAEEVRKAAEADLQAQVAASKSSAAHVAHLASQAAAAEASRQAARQLLMEAEAEAAGHSTTAFSASSAAADFGARARLLEAEVTAAESARQTAALEASIADSRAKASQAEAQRAEAASRVAMAELEITRQRRAIAELDERAALSAQRTAELSRMDSSQQAAAWAAKQAAAGAEVQAAKANLEIAKSQLQGLEVQLQIAQAQAIAAAEARVAAEAAAAGESTRLSLTTEARLTVEAEAERVRQQAEVRRFEAAAADAHLKYEQGVKDRELLLVQAQSEARFRELNESDRLARERDGLRLAAEEESALRREEKRRETEVQVAKLKSQAEAVAAEVKAKIDAEARLRDVRENEDVHLRAAAAEAVAVRERWVSAVTTALDRLGAAAHSLLTTHLQRVILSLIAVALGIYASKEGLTLLRSEVQRRIGTPPLIRETSVPRGLWPALLSGVDRLTFGAAGALWGVASGVIGAVRGTIASVATALQYASDVTWALLSGNGALPPYPSSSSKGDRFVTSQQHQQSDDPFHDVILPPDVEAQVRQLAASTANAHALGAPLRHALFYGPPGTGKSLVATRLARLCGLHYAIMSGGDVAPLGAAAVTELHRLFDWAAHSPKGLLLFIDEAEAFLGSRNRAGGTGGGGGANNNDGGEATRHALSALLARTGDAGGHVYSYGTGGGGGGGRLMLVLATNRPSDLDEAVTDRVDESVHFDQPDAEGRLRLGRLYFHRAIASRSQYGGAVAAAATVAASSSDDDTATGTASAASAVLPVRSFVSSEADALPSAQDLQTAAKEAAAAAAASGAGRKTQSSFVGRALRAAASAVAALLTAPFSLMTSLLLLLLAPLRPASTVSSSVPPIGISSDVTSEALDALCADACAGFSGRQMAKLMTAVQAAVYSQGVVRRAVSSKGHHTRPTASHHTAAAVVPVLTLSLLMSVVSNQARKVREDWRRHNEATAAVAAFASSPLLTESKPLLHQHSSASATSSAPLSSELELLLQVAKQQQLHQQVPEVAAKEAEQAATLAHSTSSATTTGGGGRMGLARLHGHPSKPQPYSSSQASSTDSNNSNNASTPFCPISGSTTSSSTASSSSEPCAPHSTSSNSNSNSDVTGSGRKFTFADEDA